MHNENRTEGQVSQGILETILKLAHSGSSPDAISFALKIDIETVQQLIANDPMNRARVIQSIKEKSRKYRCTQSCRLMISPVMARDGNFYEQSILEADSSLSIDQFIPSPKQKAEIEDFCKENLKVLEGYLRQKPPQEDILELIAECLSVLCPEAGLEPALRVISLVEGETVRKLTGKMWSLVPEQMLFGLMDQTARELPSHALYLSALIILETRSERAFEEAFKCFTELLSQAALCPEAIDLAEEVSERLISTQLRQMNAALGACPREAGDRLEGLILKEAYALLREGEVEPAISLVSTLRISPRLENEVLRFYDEAGRSSGKVPILEQRLSAKLEEISRDSPSVAETLSAVHQLLNAELHSLRSEATSQSLITLKAVVLNETLAKLEQSTSHTLIAQEERIQRLEEQAQRKEAESQEAVSSLRAKVEALTEEFVKAEQKASHTQTAQEATFRSIEGRFQESEAVAQQALSSLRDEVEAWTREYFKEEIESVKRAQKKQIKSLFKHIQELEDRQLERLKPKASIYCSRSVFFVFFTILVAYSLLGNSTKTEEHQENTVLAYALESESKTQFSEASEQAPMHFRPPPTTTEQPKPQLTKTWPNGDSYRGELLNDKPHGSGTMQYANGMTYVGDWVNGTKQGRGVWTNRSGDRYEGEWKNDKADGQGTFTWANGEVYSGSFQDDKMHGHGVHTWADGTRHEGEYENGMYHGYGVFTSPDGRRYEGEFENGKMHGHGVHTWPSGRRYEGEWENNLMHGHGVNTWPDGRRYEGEWENGMYHGHGVEVEPDGGCYTGTWSEGMKHGEFSYSKGGTSRREKWSAGVLSK
jgi:hypothetical protein